MPPTLHEYADQATTSSRAEDPSVTVEGDRATAVLEAGQSIGDLDALLVRFRLDPAEWTVDKVKANQWTSGSAVCEQLTAHLKLRIAPARFIVPAAISRDLGDPRVPTVVNDDEPRFIIVTTDSQIPFHDKHLHELSLYFAEDMQPDEWVDLGDLTDLPSLSKYRAKPEFHATFQDSIQQSADVLRSRTQAAGPKCKRKRKIRGNHDGRARNWIIEHAPELLGIKRADIGFGSDELSVLDLEFLIQSNELGWETVRSPYGEYPYEEVEITTGLWGIHGNDVRKGAGNSVRSEVERRRHSVIQGHVNKLALYAITRRGHGAGMETDWACEGGMMGQTEGGMGFAGTKSDWTKGFSVVTAWKDAFTIELAPCIDGVLYFRNRRWWHSGGRVRSS